MTTKSALKKEIEENLNYLGDFNFYGNKLIKEVHKGKGIAQGLLA